LSLSALFAICASRCMSVSNSLSLHDALPISPKRISKNGEESVVKLTRSFVENGLTVQEIRDLEIESDVFIELLDLGFLRQNHKGTFDFVEVPYWLSEWYRSEEHTSELQSRFDLVC